jgi:hypothetical protein
MATSCYKWLGKTALLFGLFFMNVSFVWHPFFVSVSEIEYNATEKTMEISCKVFTDDLEKALTKFTSGKVDVYNPKEKAILEKQIERYITSHFLMKVDGKPVVMDFIGYEIEQQSTLSYYQVNQVNTKPHKVEIQNTIFYPDIEKQMGIMHVTIGGNRKSTKVDYPESYALFEF